MFQARRTCLPGGVQGSEVHLNGYFIRFDSGWHDVTFLIRTAMALQEAESFPAVQIWGPFLGFYGLFLVVKGLLLGLAVSSLFCGLSFP